MSKKIQIDLPKEQIAAFCRKWQIAELALFGSVLRKDFRPESDVDVLVTFAQNAQWGFDQLLEMKTELEALFGRPVDMVERRLVDESPNYIRRRHILTHMEPIYVAR
jgi:predicted nucleotidyltransferase